MCIRPNIVIVRQTIIVFFVAVNEHDLYPQAFFKYIVNKIHLHLSLPDKILFYYKPSIHYIIIMYYKFVSFQAYTYSYIIIFTGLIDIILQQIDI